MLIKQFESDRKIKTFVPSIIGKTSRSIALKNKTSWTEEGFLMAVKDVDEELVDVCNVILAGFRSFGCEINWGKGKKTPSFVPSYTKIDCLQYMLIHHLLKWKSILNFIKNHILIKIKSKK